MVRSLTTQSGANFVPTVIPCSDPGSGACEKSPSVRMPLPRGLVGQFDCDGALAGLRASKPNGVPVLAPEQPVSDTIAAASSNKFSRILSNSSVVRYAPAGLGFCLLRQMIVAKTEELVVFDVVHTSSWRRHRGLY
jgi:hypothetical protein